MRAVAAGFLTLAGLAAGPAEAAARVPVDDAEVLVRVPPADDPAERPLAALARRLAQAPDDAESAVALARASIERGRATGDPRHFGRAEAALRPWWSMASPPVEVHLARATLLQQRHDFAAALADLDRLIAQHPRVVQARLTRAIVLQVQGRPHDAEPDCRALATARPPVAAACLGSVLGVSGRSREALGLLAEAFRSGEPSVAVWAATTRGEIHARRGEMAEADAAFGEALSLLRAADAADLYLPVAYADFLLDHGRAADALALMAPYPPSDALLLRRALALRRLADGGDAQATAGMATLRQQLRDRAQLAQARGDEGHAREHAWLELRLNDAPGAALPLAVRNWHGQREPLDARLLLEAALAAGRADAAGPVLRWMDDTGIEDVVLAALRSRVEAAQ